VRRLGTSCGLNWTAGLVGFMLVCLFALAGAASAQAATIHVTTSADDGSAGSLRQAIATAEADAPGDTIVIDPGVNPTLFTLGAITILQGDSLTIEGQGARSTAISPASGGSIFLIGPYNGGFPAVTNVTISGLTLASVSPASDSAIDVQNTGTGSVGLTDVALVGNSASQNDGGAVHASNNTNVTLNHVTATGNASTFGGGAIAADGGSVTISDSTISGNQASHGGGVYSCCGGVVTLTADTISGNTATRGSGGNLFSEPPGELPAGQFNLQDTIVVAGSVNNCGGSGFTSDGFNLEDTTPSQCGLSANLADVIGVNPMLGSLGNYGGQTDTIPLLAGSPAVDAVPNCAAGIDQRGMPRPDVSETSCDIGAYEFQDAPSITLGCSPGALIVGRPTTCTATVTNSAGPAAGAPTGTVTFSSNGGGGFGGGGATCKLTGSGASADCSVIYTPTAVGSGVHTLTAKYSGDNAYPPGSATTTVTVATRPDSMTVACSPTKLTAGTTTACTATVSDVAGGAPQPPSGMIAFATNGAGAFSGNSQCLLSGSGGSASCVVTYTPSAATSGGQTITASYPGDGTYAAQTGSTGVQMTPVVVEPKHNSSASVSCSPGVVRVGGTTTCAVTVSDASGTAKSAPTGTVSLAPASGLSGPGSCSLTPSGATSAKCSASYTLSASAAGTYSIAITYGGDQSYNASGRATSIAPTPEAGVTADLQVVSGTVTIELPASGKAQDARAAAGIQTLVPLKGSTVNVPVGSTVDTRKGVVALTTAADFRPSTAPKHVVSTGTFSVAIFAIEQQSERQAVALAHKRHRRRVTSAPSTDLNLKTPPGAVTHARCRRVGSPGKGVVRALAGTAKGLYRTIGATSITTIENATWVVKDRCDGTETEVGRGHATVTPIHPGRSHQHSVVIGPGQGVLIKGRFA
jgi:hypothetical protein